MVLTGATAACYTTATTPTPIFYYCTTLCQIGVILFGGAEFLFLFYISFAETRTSDTSE